MDLFSIFEKSFIDFNGDESFVYLGDDQSNLLEFDENNSFQYEFISSSEDKNKEKEMMFSNFESSPIKEVSEKEGSEKSSKSDTSINSKECKKLIGNKRGRKTKQESINKSKKSHTKNKADNIKRKIQVHFLTFLIQLLNAIMNKLNLNYSFKDLDYDYKQNTKNTNLKEMKTKTIKQILLEAPITTKYTQINKNHNKEQIKSIEENEEYLSKYLDNSYLYFFENIYYKNVKTINLDLLNNNFVNIDISQTVNTFEKINMFEKNDLLYEKNLDKIAKNFYLNNKKY